LPSLINRWLPSRILGGHILRSRYYQAVLFHGIHCVKGLACFQCHFSTLRLSQFFCCQCRYGARPFGLGSRSALKSTSIPGARWVTGAIGCWRSWGCQVGGLEGLSCLSTGGVLRSGALGQLVTVRPDRGSAQVVVCS
jgi:hypothetical protein